MSGPVLTQRRIDELLNAIARAVKQVQGNDVPPILSSAGVELSRTEEEGPVWFVHFRGRAELPVEPPKRGPAQSVRGLAYDDGAGTYDGGDR